MTIKRGTVRDSSGTWKGRRNSYHDAPLMRSRVSVVEELREAAELRTGNGSGEVDRRICHYRRRCVKRIHGERADMQVLSRKEQR
jgi:hypothetical protein